MARPSRPYETGKEALLSPESPVSGSPISTESTGADIRVRDSPESSNIRSAQFDPSTVQLVITFKNGTRYAYEAFPLDMWMEYNDAPSVGKYFAQRIRPLFTGKKL